MRLLGTDDKIQAYSTTMSEIDSEKQPPPPFTTQSLDGIATSEVVAATPQRLLEPVHKRLIKQSKSSSIKQMA
jgi:hypothetical protein